MTKAKEPKVKASDFGSDPSDPPKDPSAVAQAKGEEAENPFPEVSLTNNVIVRLKAVSPFLVNATLRQIEKPVPPTHTVKLDDGAEVEEETFGDPKYLREVDEYDKVAMDAIVDLFIEEGIEVVELPAGITDQDDESWHTSLARRKIPLADDPIDRRIQWLKLYILTSAKDVDDTVHQVAQMSGLRDEEVMAAIQAFRSRALRRAGDRVRNSASRDGDNVPKSVAGNGVAP